MEEFWRRYRPFRMPGNITGLILLNILVAFSVSSGQPCNPRYPALIPGPGGDDPTQDNGIWYAYRQNGNVTVNQIVTVTGFGPTIDALTGLAAYRQYVQFAFSTSPQRATCQNMFTIQTYVVNGNVVGNQAMSSDNYAVIRLSAFNILYHDYANLVVAYGCAVPKADGTCDTPIIWAETRVNPNQLTADQTANFDKIINGVFKDYCITTDLLPKQIHDSSQALCPKLDPPACLDLLVKGFQETGAANTANGPSTSSSVAYGSSTSTSAPATGCKWPVFIPAAVKYDPAQHEGVWYVYRQMWSAEPTATNMRIYWHNLGKGVLPLTNRTGNYVWGESAQYNSPDTTQCSFGYWTGFFSSAGENLGFRFVTVDGHQLPLRTTTLYADDKYRFDYGCVTPILETNTCNDPFIMFSARADPAHWSDSDKAHWDNDIIGAAFKQYGCTAQDITAMQHRSEKPACSFEGGTACVRQYIAGLSELVQPVKVSY